MRAYDGIICLRERDLTPQNIFPARWIGQYSPIRRQIVMTADNRLEFNEAFDTGAIVRVILEPVWTLVEAERKAALW